MTAYREPVSDAPLGPADAALAVVDRGPGAEATGAARVQRHRARRAAAWRAGGLAALVVVWQVADLPGWATVAVGVAVAVGLLGLVAAIGKAIWGPRWDASFWLSVVWLVALCIASVGAGVLPLADPYDADFANLRERPKLSWSEPLGTDQLGRSQLSRTVHGARVTVAIALSAVAIGVLVGGTVGLIAGFVRGFLDRVASMVGDVMLSFPPLILLMAMVTVLPRSGTTIALGLGVLTIPAFFRIARANTLVLVQREFVTAARAMGASSRRVLTRELLPNILTPVAAYVFVLLALVIVAEGSLSYLGVGVQPPTPTWGRMIADGQPAFDTTPHLVFVPSLVMFVTLYALNTVGDRLRASETPVL